MNWKVWMCMAAAGLFSSAMFAQMGEDEPVEEDYSAYYMDENDHDKDGKVTKEEIKKTSAKDAEGGTDLDIIEAYGDVLLTWLVADTNDDGSVTKSEIKAFYESEEQGKLSAADWSTYEKEYVDEMLKVEMKKYDTDKDGALSKTEAGAIEEFDPDTFTLLDEDKDGKVTTTEYKSVLKKSMSQQYTIEEAGDTTDEPKGDEIPANVRENFAGMDTDKDGFVSETEWNNVVVEESHGTAQKWGIFLVFTTIDTNNDMKFDLNEAYEYTKIDARGGKHKLFPADKKQVLDRIYKDLDKDEDGKVTRAEYTAIAPAGSEGVYGAEFDNNDTDKNGDMSREEIWPVVTSGLTNVEIVEKDESSSEDGAKPAEGGDADSDNDGFALYRKQGRTWMHKTTMVVGTMKIENYMKWEILEVTETHATYKLSMLDADKKETYSSESKIEFNTPKPAEGGETPESPAIETTEETVTVEAGEFDCTVYTSTANGTTTKTWLSKKYPALVIKMEMTGAVKSSQELIEFNE